MILEKKWAGPRITFGFSLCPICKVGNSHFTVIIECNKLIFIEDIVHIGGHYFSLKKSDLVALCKVLFCLS